MREKGQTEVAKTLETPVFSRGIEILTEKTKLFKIHVPASSGNEKYRRPVDAGLLYFALLLLSVVYLQAMEHFDKAGIIVADDLAMPHI